MDGIREREFQGRRALVTGGTKGMGEAILERLRASGASVVTTARSGRRPICARRICSWRPTSAPPKAPTRSSATL